MRTIRHGTADSGAVQAAGHVLCLLYYRATGVEVCRQVIVELIVVLENTNFFRMSNVRMS